jgi:hypothetical protein
MMQTENDIIRQAYRKTFETGYGLTVLTDLAEYCNFLETTEHEGRRDVFLHILDNYGIIVPDAIRAIHKVTAKEKHEQEEADNS